MITMEDEGYTEEESKKILETLKGKKVTDISFCHDYVVVKLDDGTEIEGGLELSEETKNQIK